MTDEEIINEIKKYPGEWVVLTGGEPAMWIDYEFLQDLKSSTGKKIAIETNGSIELPDGIDWVTVSPKSGINGAGIYEIKVRKADEIKVVDIGQNLEEYFALPCVKENTIFSLQPCYEGDYKKNKENIENAVSRVLKDPRWRLSLQTHRILNIR